MIPVMMFDAQGLVRTYTIPDVDSATEWLESLGTVIHVTQGHKPHKYVYLGVAQSRGFMVIMDFSKVNGGREFKYDA